MIRTLLEEDDNALAVCEGSLVCPESGSVNRDARLKNSLKPGKTARKLIVKTLEKKPMELIMSFSTAREMWLKLNSIYDMTSDENLSVVQKQFFDYKWTESESVAYNLSKLEILSNKMKNLGSEILESMFITRILSSLPKKFNQFQSAWNSVEDKKRNVENLTMRLIAEELRLQDQEEIRETSTVLFAKCKIDESKNNQFRKDRN